MRIDRRLADPEIDQKDRLGVVEGNPVLVPRVARLLADGVDRA